MNNAVVFVASPNCAFRGSPNVARNGQPPCPPGFPEVNVAKKYYGIGGGDPLALTALETVGRFQSPVVGMPAEYQTIPQLGTDPENFYQTQFGGKWKITLRLKLYRNVVADPARPWASWIFLNLNRGAIAGNDPRFYSLIATQSWQDGEFVSPIPSLPGAELFSADDPAAFGCSKKWNIAEVTATPDAPYEFPIETIIAPEITEYCYPWYYFSMVVGTFALNLNPSSFIAVVAPSDNSAPGYWDFTVSPDVTEEVLWLSGTGTATYNGYPLFEIEMNARRIPPLHALFKASYQGGNKVQFNNFSQGNPTASHWDFGDDQTSDEQSPLHTFPGPGTYAVSLTITNEIGDTDTHTVNVEVPLIANFTFSPAAYATVRFTNKSINAANYDWDFGDGSAHSGLANPQHTFPVGAHVYQVKLTINDGAGHFAEFTLPVTIGPALVANWSFAAVPPPAPAHTVQFSDTSTGTVVAWRWTIFESGGFPQTIYTVQNPAHTFRRSGLFNQITLQVTDAQGFTATKVGQISAP